MEFIPFPNEVAVGAQAPSASIKLYSGVPWDLSYTHVRLYDNRGQLDAFLETLKKFESAQVSFINVGTMNVAIDYNQALAYKCNYMRFVNAPWDDTPHYAFVKSVSSVSTNVTQLTFELDVWNECQFDFELKECFVEREIVKKSEDIRGNFTYPENLQLGDYIANGDSTQTIPKEGDERRELMFCVASAVDNFGETATLGTYQNVPSGLYIGTYASLGDLQGYLTTVLEKKGTLDDIVDSWIMPAIFADKENLVKRTFTFKKSSVTTIDGYKPKNNKMYTFPFCYLQMTNNSGQIKQFEMERFHDENDDECNFNYTVNLAPNPTLYCYPVHYKGVAENYGDSITFNGYPKIAFPVDAYKAWLAQNSNNLIVSMATGENIPTNPVDWIGRGVLTLTQMVGSLGSLFTGNSGGATNSMADMVTHVIGGSYKSELQANGIKGSISNTLPTAANFDCLSVYPVSITAEYAKIIDNYFTMYGYKICRIKKPQLTGRKSWNYVKTQNCSIDGKFPIDMLEKVRQIFDNGVTVWHTNDVGNYSLNND